MWFVAVAIEAKFVAPALELCMAVVAVVAIVAIMQLSAQWSG